MAEPLPLIIIMLINIILMIMITRQSEEMRKAIQNTEFVTFGRRPSGVEKLYYMYIYIYA